MASLIRDAVDRTHPSDEVPTRAEQWKRALAAVGAFRSDGRPVSREHDLFLDGAYADWAEKPS
jgi:hypothetical protein